MTESPTETTLRIDRPKSAPAEQDFETPILPRHGWFLPFKAAVDCLGALVLLVATGPVILLAALAVKLTSRGPAFYSQVRLGKNSRPFRLYKLRTMVENAEEMTGPTWAQAEDPRVTRVGRFLRDTHIDEFPQLVNVLLGQMSLIGPRPERPEFVGKLEWYWANYRSRLNVRPGITGIAQLNLPPDCDLESVRRKLIQDLYYVRYVNPWLDFRIALFTAWELVRMLTRAVWTIFDLPDGTKVQSRVQRVVGTDSDLFVQCDEQLQETSPAAR